MDAALRPDDGLKNLILLTAPLDFTDKEHISLARMTDERNFNVDRVLQADVNYTAMDFATRDSYRHAIEELARGSSRAELDVAREAIAQAARSEVRDGRRNDPGFYLVGAGRRALEAGGEGPGS